MDDIIFVDSNSKRLIRDSVSIKADKNTIVKFMERESYRTCFTRPFTKANNFEYTVKIRSLCFQVRIGVVNVSHPVDDEIGERETYGWCVAWRRSYSKEIRLLSCDPWKKKEYRHELKPGDSITFGIMKDKKKMFFKVNNGRKKYMEIQKNFPDTLVLAVSYQFKNVPLDVEITSFIDHENRGLSVEQTERIQYLLDPKMSDIDVSLSNKELHLWKSILYTSVCTKLPFEILSSSSSSRYESLSNRSFETIDERNILLILLGKDFNHPSSSSLIDYFLFFRELGCLLGMKTILEEMGRTMKNLNFWEIFKIFKSLCVERIENIIQFDVIVEEEIEGENSQKVKTKRRKNPVIIKGGIDLSNFQTSMGVYLFNLMKEKLFSGDQIDITRLFTSMEECLEEEEGNFMPLAYHLQKYRILNPYKHSDFCPRTNIIDFELPFRMFKEMNDCKDEENEKKFYSNIKLIPSSNRSIVFRAHKEILIFRSNFFKHMFHFRGAEILEYEKTGEIELIYDVGEADVLKVYLHYLYTGKLPERIVGDELNILLKLLRHAQSYMEKRLIGLIEKKIRSADTSTHLSCMDVVKMYKGTSLIQDVHLQDVMSSFLKRLASRDNDDFFRLFLNEFVSSEKEEHNDKLEKKE